MLLKYKKPLIRISGILCFLGIRRFDCVKLKITRIIERLVTKPHWRLIQTARSSWQSAMRTVFMQIWASNSRIWLKDVGVCRLQYLSKHPYARSYSRLSIARTFEHTTLSNKAFFLSCLISEAIESLLYYVLEGQNMFRSLRDNRVACYSI